MFCGLVCYQRIQRHSTCYFALNLISKNRIIFKSNLPRIDRKAWNSRCIKDIKLSFSFFILFLGWFFCWLSVFSSFVSCINLPVTVWICTIFLSLAPWPSLLSLKTLSPQLLSLPSLLFHFLMQHWRNSTFCLNSNLPIIGFCLIICSLLLLLNHLFSLRYMWNLSFSTLVDFILYHTISVDNLHWVQQKGVNFQASSH